MTETLFAAPVYWTYGALIAEEKYQPAGFKLELRLKDVNSVLAAAEAKSVPRHRAWRSRSRLVGSCAGYRRGCGPQVLIFF
jgi:3-hydroxyisobutyrate dehydrogenase-like beta-hydroxyacid dehydrogenase